MNILILIITVALSLAAFNNRNLFDKALFRPYLIKHNNEWWRWFSNGFIHADYTHLIVNMLTFYFFGGYILAVFKGLIGPMGSIVFVVYYLLAIAVSSSYSYHKHKDNYGYAALGASGAVSAIIFSYILFNPFGKIQLYFIVGIPAWLFGILYLWYEWYMGKKMGDNIGHDAHFFGAVFGFIFPILLKPETGLAFIQQFIELFSR
ncbi:MAG TPA: rhomboid family intramembrane serine protease [Bacteroidia bacterium]